jgi:signal transduction histidine kinase
MFKFLKVRAKGNALYWLSLTSGLFILLIWLFISYELKKELEFIIKTSNSNLQNIVRSFKEHSEDTITNSDELLRIIKFNYEKYGTKDFKTLNAYFQNGVLDMKFFNQVGIIDEQGIYSFSNLPITKKIDLSDREHFKIHKDIYPYSIFLSKPVLGRASGRWSIQLTRRLNKPDGSFNGVAVVSFDPTYFVNFYKKIDLGSNGFTALVGLDGTIRTIRAGEKTSINSDNLKIQIPNEYLDQENGFFTTSQIFDGTKRIYAFEKLSNQPLFVLVGITENDALLDYERSRQSYLIFGTLLSFLIILFTLTSLKMIHKTIEINEQSTELNNRLLQSEKLAALGQLSAGVAHEINNPIGYVSSNISSLNKYFLKLEDLINLYDEYFKKSYEIDETQDLNDFKKSINYEFIKEDTKFLLNETLEGISKVKDIITDLKNFARSDSTENWQKVDLLKNLKSTLNIVNNEIRYNADVEIEIPNLPEIECLPTQLNQVFLNLIVNAAQAVKPNVRGLIKISARELNESVMITFSDNGQGIDKANILKIFNPFYTTKEVGKGTGLGLSVSHGIIQKHNGKIEVESKIGEGTVFTLTLPIHQPPK